MMGSRLARLLSACSSSKCHQCRAAQHPLQATLQQPRRQLVESGRHLRVDRPIRGQCEHFRLPQRAPLAPVPLENWRLTPPLRPPPPRREPSQPPDPQRQEPLSPTSAASSIVQLSPDVRLRHRKRRPDSAARKRDPILGDRCRVRLKRATGTTGDGAVQVIDSWPQVQLRPQRRQRESSQHREHHKDSRLKQTTRQKLHAFCCLPVSRWTLNWLRKSGDSIAALASRFDCSLTEATGSATCELGEVVDGCCFLEIWGPNVAKVRQFHDRLLTMAECEDGWL